MAANAETLNLDYENLELLDLINELGDLKKEVKDNPKTWTEKPREWNWAIIFNYESKTTNEKWEIVTRKQWDTYNVRVKTRILFPAWKDWKTNQTFDFSAEDSTKFNEEFLKIINDNIPVSKKDMRKKGILRKNSESVYKMLNKWNSDKQNSSKESAETQPKTNLNKKPIDLHYTEKNKEKKVKINYPANQTSVEWRICRCLRFTSITDSVEQRYWIPSWLLLALMAQEGWWDPTVINLNWDWWAGLIHIQATNAANYWMKTMKRYNDYQKDFEHWKILKKAKEDTHNDLKQLSELDDRFNPVMGIDVSARFLLWDKWWKNATTWDEWVTSICKYAWRWMKDYWYSVLVYWTTINKVRWKKMPEFKEKETNKVINWDAPAFVNGTREKTTFSIERTKKAIDNLNPQIDEKDVSIKDYYKYLEWQWNNYWLREYINFDKQNPYIK